MASRAVPELASRPADDEQQNVDCAACLSGQGTTISPAADCSNSAQMDVFTEAFFAFAPAQAAVPIDILQSFAGASVPARDSVQSQLGAASGPPKTFVIFPVPLRI